MSTLNKWKIEGNTNLVDSVFGGLNNIIEPTTEGSSRYFICRTETNMQTQNEFFKPQHNTNGLPWFSVRNGRLGRHVIL